MTDEYTPTVAQVRDFWASDGKRQPAAKSYDEAESAAEFDRWLVSVRADAWDEGNKAGWDENDFGDTRNPYREGEGKGDWPPPLDQEPSAFYNTQKGARND